MVIPKELKPMIEKYAKAYGIDPNWVSAIISKESSWDILAIRYEAQYPYLYNVKTWAKKSRVSEATEETSQKISWGLGQIMGALAREQGLIGPIPSLLHPEVNIEHVCIRLKRLKELSSDRDDVFAAYNGGPGAIKKMASGLYVEKIQKYVDGVNAFLKQLA